MPTGRHLDVNGNEHQVFACLTSTENQSIFCNSKLQLNRDKKIRKFKNSTIETTMLTKVYFQLQVSKSQRNTHIHIDETTEPNELNEPNMKCLQQRISECNSKVNSCYG